MKLINLLTSPINYFATESKSSCDRRRQWIDTDEKRDCLHQQSEGRETQAWEITRLGLRIRAFFRRKRGTKSGMWKRLQFGENKGKSNVDFRLFFLIPSQGHFRNIINGISFLSILRLYLGGGLNFVRYMDHLLIFGPSWAQNTILPSFFCYASFRTSLAKRR